MAQLDWVPQACTLPTAERPLRVAEWDTLFARRLRVVTRASSSRVRLELMGGPGVEHDVRALAEREAGCCSFFTFTVTAEAGAVQLDVTVDQAHKPVLVALAERAEAVAGSVR
ncbi:hypothetical protein [Streptomyces sp. NPDC026673]|uniref:hypothetical protein n=1 Tax=Streptomyces sp. NPDC026673 TaxID=3155724 RepID=UPI0033EFBC99